MARRQLVDPYDTDKEKRELAAARAAELKARTGQIEGKQNNRYTQQFGYPDLPTMTAAVTAGEHERSAKTDEAKTKIEALKALHSSAMLSGNQEHAQAALDALAKEAGVTVPKKAMDPKTKAMNELRAKKGLPPLPGTEETKPGDTTGLVAPQQQQSGPSFQPIYGGPPEEVGPVPGTAPVPSRIEGEASLGNPITPHLGIGGALMTPENPTGNPANPWGAGGLFDNPTHAAAMNVQAREAAVHPFGSDNSPLSRTYFPGEAMDRLAGGSVPRPANQLPARPAPAAMLVSNQGPGFPQSARPAPFQFVIPLTFGGVSSWCFD